MFTKMRLPDCENRYLLSARSDCVNAQHVFRPQHPCCKLPFLISHKMSAAGVIFARLLEATVEQRIKRSAQRFA
jgi:hypothetical protein